MVITKKQLKMSVSIIIAISAIILIFVLFAGKEEPVPQASKNKTITAQVPAAAKLSPVAQQMHLEAEKMDDKELSVYCKEVMEQSPNSEKANTALELLRSVPAKRRERLESRLKKVRPQFVDMSQAANTSQAQNAYSSPIDIIQARTLDSVSEQQRMMSQEKMISKLPERYQQKVRQFNAQKKTGQPFNFDLNDNGRHFYPANGFEGQLGIDREVRLTASPKLIPEKLSEPKWKK